MRLRPFAMLALLLGVSGCERGCLSAWLGDPAAGGNGPRGSGTPDGASSSLTGTDCSDGLARCVDGRVEASVAGYVPHPCVSAREQGSVCECPWKAVGHCGSGCVKDGLEIVATAEVAAVQLCKPTGPALRPVLPAEATAVAICADEVVSCGDGIVRSCAARGQPARLVTGCVWGCAPGARIEPGDLANDDGVASILCRRDHAERR